MTELSRSDALAALRWLVESGADECVADMPIDRFAPKPAASMARQVGNNSPALTTPASEPGFARRAIPGSTVGQAEGAGRAAASSRIAASAEAVSLSTLPGMARTLAASCKSLQELEAALKSFDGCELKRLATNTVFADGDPSGRIMLIGEAPGRDEDAQGLPFVGRAGQLLDRMLAAIGLDRTKVYITNVLPWRPPSNREPSPEEAAACLPFLHRHIELADPALMILLGAVSVRHVLGFTEGIMRVRGRWESYQGAGLSRAVPVMPTLHPAFLLRQPAAKRLAWRDLMAVAEKIEALGL